MTAEELYNCDPGFRGFLAVWREDKRCPLPLVDYLLELDMPVAADCARWAATCVKHTAAPLDVAFHQHPYPYKLGSDKSPTFRWYTSPEASDHRLSDVVPQKNTTQTKIVTFARVADGSTVEESICDLMDRWVINDNGSS